MAASTREAPNPGAVNAMYVPLINVELSGVVFPVYGSMSWTVAQVKKRDWDTEVHPAYVGLTGDTRPGVDRDQATSVVSGELQFTWAEVSGRQDLLPALRDNQEKRVASAVVSEEAAKKKGRGSGGSRAARGASSTAQARRRGMAENEQGAEGGAATATPELEAKVGPTGVKLPTRGFMGSVRSEIEKLQAAGRGAEDDITEEEVLSAAEAAHPEVQNGARHMRYVARIMGVKLVKPTKAEEPAAEGPDAAKETEDAEGEELPVVEE